MTPYLIDCDDVLLDWIGGFGAYATRRTGRPLRSPTPDDWNMSPWLGAPAHLVEEMIADFNAGDGGHFGFLPARPDALAALPILHAAGHPLHVITSCSADTGIQAARRNNLQLRFGDIFDSVTCLPLGVSKTETLRQYAAGCVWIEDNHRNAIDGADAGHRTYVMRRSHNRAKENACNRRDLTWVNDWSEILIHERRIMIDSKHDMRKTIKK